MFSSWRVAQFTVNAKRLKCSRCKRSIAQGQKAVVEKDDGQTWVYCLTCGQIPLNEYELHQIECDTYGHGQE